jgi:histidinol-phosphatase
VIASGSDRSAALRRGDEAELQRWLESALAWTDEADAEAMRHFRRDLEITTKPDRTLVTQADKAIERRLRERILAAHPTHGLIGEEYGTEAAGASVRWYIDPIDGTHNFVRGVPLFGTLLAVERDGIRQVGIMSAPAIRERWFARRGGGAWALGSFDEAPRRIRVSGVAAVADAQLLYGSGASIERSGRAPGFLELRHAVWRERGFGDFWGYALVAEGAAEAMVEVGVSPWDLAAPEVVVDEAGGLLTDFAGTARIDGREVLATNGLLHQEMLARLQGKATAAS